ncbi:hypothetical protein ABN028_29615 [Actinopolymorpha sp. B17G11]|uniref:hypothetical protein n=1 Tax=Actinopolymorpha sp. B17G11 TaxID=3160861 RepID=UPI0032E39044
MPDPVIGRLLLITGASAAGKTTVGHEVASLLSRAVHIDGDAMQRFVVSGAVPMDVPPPPGAVEQLTLRYAAAMTVSSLYRRAGFDAVITDNVFEAETAAEIVDRLDETAVTQRELLVRVNAPERTTS